ALAMGVGRLASAGSARQDLRPEDVAKAYVAAYNDHNVAKLGDLYADDVVVVVPDLSIVKGKADNIKYFEAWFRSVPDVNSAIKTLTIEDDRFILELVETGTYTKA